MSFCSLTPQQCLVKQMQPYVAIIASNGLDSYDLIVIITTEISVMLNLIYVHLLLFQLPSLFMGK